MKTLKLIMFCSLLSTFSFGQWDYTWDLPGTSSEGIELIEIPNGNFVAVGERISSGGSVGIMTIVNPEGEELYTTDFIDYDLNVAWDIKTVVDGMLIAGESNKSYPEKDSLMVIKTDFDGNILWTHKYFEIIESASSIDLLILDDGSFIISSIGEEVDVTLARVESNGQLINSILLADSYFHFTTELLITNDGGILLAGGTGGKPWMRKIDVDGNLIWESIYSEPSGIVTSVLEDESGNIYASGYLDQMNIRSGFLFKYDAEGNLLTENFYSLFNQVNGATTPLGMCFSHDDQIIITGSKIPDVNIANFSLFVIKLNLEGELLAEWQFEELLAHQSSNSIIRLEDNTYALTGIVADSLFSQRSLLISKFSEEDFITSSNNLSKYFLEDILLFPNPNIGYFNYQFTLKEKAPIQYSILNSLGQEIEEWSPIQVFPSGTHQLNFDVSHLPKGLYFVSLNLDDKTIPISFIKE